MIYALKKAHGQPAEITAVEGHSVYDPTAGKKSPVVQCYRVRKAVVAHRSNNIHSPFQQGGEATSETTNVLTDELPVGVVPAKDWTVQVGNKKYLVVTARLITGKVVEMRCKSYDKP